MSMKGPGRFQTEGEGSGRVRSGMFHGRPRASGAGEICLLEKDALRISAVCVLCLPKRSLACWPKGPRVGVGWGQAAGHWSGPRGGSGGERGGQGTLVSWVPFLAAAEAVGAPPPCPLRCGLQAVCSAGRGRLAVCHGLVGAPALGPQNRMPSGSRASRSTRGPGEGLPEELAEAQWSRLAPMQAAYAITWGM